MRSMSYAVFRLTPHTNSHWHADHTGDPSTFPPTTELVVGPGFKNKLLPGYPADPNGLILESDHAYVQSPISSSSNGSAWC